MKTFITSAAIALSLAVSPALASPSGQHSANASDHSAQASAEGSAAIASGTAVVASVPVMVMGSTLLITGAALQSVGEDMVVSGVTSSTTGLHHDPSPQGIVPNGPPTLD
ncbi:MAG: hypothetical protein ACSHW1_15530 [Yoonia sp.]|uniref:hypothetical protein n=1 Tax=Yoonia sp. TaxID=2212373 RepID=UPI003EF67817